MTTADYEISQCSVRQLKLGNTCRVQIEDYGNPTLTVRIAREPVLQLSRDQLYQLADLLKIDGPVLEVARLLEANVIHGDPIKRKTLVKLFERP